MIKNIIKKISIITFLLIFLFFGFNISADDENFTGYAWYDVNCDGVFDAGEEKVEGVKISSWYKTNDGSWKDTTISASTNNNGLFTLNVDKESENDYNGFYKIKFELPNGYDKFSPKTEDSNVNSNGFSEEINHPANIEYFVYSYLNMKTFATTSINAGLCKTLKVKGHSGKIHSGKSAKKVCKNSKALNFSNVGQHDESLCRYKDFEKEKTLNNQENEKGQQRTEDDKQICPIFTQHMRNGDRDGRRAMQKQEKNASSIVHEVKLLQKYLKKQGFNSGPIDGIFGNKTEKAVRDWQWFHRKNVLDPWNLTHTTGRFYQSSERWMNEILGCHDEVVLDTGVVLK